MYYLSDHFPTLIDICSGRTVALPQYHYIAALLLQGYSNIGAATCFNLLTHCSHLFCVMSNVSQSLYSCFLL